MPRLLQIKQLDGRRDEGALLAYERALRDPHPAARYWAVIGLQQACTEPTTRQRFLPTLRLLLGDPSEVVRIALAETLCKWGDHATAKLLLEPLLSHRQEHLRLFAVSVLRRCEPLARLLVEQLRRCLEDTSEDVRKAAQTALQRLETG